MVMFNIKRSYPECSIKRQKESKTETQKIQEQSLTQLQLNLSYNENEAETIFRSQQLRMYWNQ